MKRTCLYFVAFLLCFSSNAQTIHWLTFIDTTDKNVDKDGIDHGVGEMDLVARKVLYSKFVGVVNSALAEKGYKSDIQDYWDISTSPENCKKAVTSLSCKPEDIVVFYYIGHGGRPQGENVREHPYPQMFLAQKYDEKLIPLEWVHETLKSKCARLTITIGMCCNVKDENMSIKRTPSFQTVVNYGNAYVPDNSVKSIQKLFLESKGDIIATSASPGQASWGAVGFSEFGGIDDYTACFVDKFTQMASNGDLEWNRFFTEVGDYVKYINRTMSRGSGQTPIFSANINNAPKPSQQERNRPSENVDTKKDEIADEARGNGEGNNIITEYFDYIIDKNVSLEDRVLLAQRLRSIFASNAVVKILAQDVDQVIDKETVDVFFDRISSSRILLKVQPVSLRYGDNNEFVELRVREYYKQTN